MRLLLLVTGLVFAVQAEAQEAAKIKFDRTDLSSLGNRVFDTNIKASRTVFDKNSQLKLKSFKSKKSAVISRQSTLGFGNVKSPQKAGGIFNKKLELGKVSGSSQKNRFFDAQKRFDISKQPEYAKTDLEVSGQKTLKLAQKRYTGREAELVRQHLDQLQREERERLDLDGSALSVEQIREILNKK